MLVEDKANLESKKSNGKNNVANNSAIMELNPDRGAEIQAYIDTDRKLHWLSQVLAKTNQTFVPDKPDHSHINLYFDALANRIDGRWIDIGRGRLMLTINLVNQSLEWLNTYRELIYTIETVGKTMAEIENELIKSFPEVGLNHGNYVNNLYYDMIDYGFTTVEPIEKLSLRQWRMHRRLANNLSSLVLGYLDIDGETRISPKNFNTRVYSEFNEQMGFRFGLAMENSIVGCPYFYLTGTPIHGHIDYEELPKLKVGRWFIGDNWKGAILPLCDIRNGKYDGNKDMLNHFLITAIDWYTTRHAYV
ncbi:MAG: hypothetical protein ABFS32_14690 [Bacteroidota bacterium]